MSNNFKIEKMNLCNGTIRKEVIEINFTEVQINELEKLAEKYDTNIDEFISYIVEEDLQSRIDGKNFFNMIDERYFSTCILGE